MTMSDSVAVQPSSKPAESSSLAGELLSGGTFGLIGVGQAAAFAMAVFFQGMEMKESVALGTR